MQASAIRIPAFGGPELMTLSSMDLPAPGAGQVTVRHVAIGVNFIDVYHRTGVYPMPLPAGIGSEGAGVIEAVGPDVTLFKVGDRVAYAGGAPGSYADRRVMPAAVLVPIPAGVTEDQAAASMLKGMTTEYLLNRCVSLKAGDYALMYAAAGGVGLFAGQWAKHMGVKLIGVAAGAEKCALAAAHGYHTVIDRKTDDVLARVKAITDGKMLPVVFDSVGKQSFETSIDCLAPRGILVSFGATTGAPPPVDVNLLARKGSLYVTRPSLGAYNASRAELEASAGALFALIASGAVKPQIGKRYPLAEAAQAHRDLEAGLTSGSSLLIP